MSGRVSGARVAADRALTLVDKLQRAREVLEQQSRLSPGAFGRAGMLSARPAWLLLGGPEA